MLFDLLSRLLSPEPPLEVQIICIPAIDDHPSAGSEFLPKINQLLSGEEQATYIGNTVSGGEQTLAPNACSSALLGAEETTRASVPSNSIDLGAVNNVVQHGFAFAASSGVAIGTYNLFKTWIDARNGRKIKIKIGDLEVETTQMKEAEVVRLFELLEEKADRRKMRELLLKANDLKWPRSV